MGNHFTRSWSAETPPQPEEAIFFILEPNNKGPLTTGSLKQFLIRSAIIGIGMTAVKFLMRERIPSIREAIGVLLIFSLLGMLVVWLSRNLNAVARRQGVLGIISMLLLAGAILVVI
ncbi:hypothetical protein HY491_00725 [Candidatus Woesearchaeota archaeon]|nr:hypothetical protein [Candidatus Woesearchaeota archaeon]